MPNAQHSPDLIARRRQTMTAICALLAASSSALSAQRPAPKVTHYGNPATKEIVQGRLVNWDAWALRAESCNRAAKNLECSVAVMNGGDDKLTLCLGEAALLFPGTTDSTRMTILSSTEFASPKAAARGYECVSLPAHKQATVIVRATVPVNRPLHELAFTLIEPAGSSSPHTSFKARARVPVSGL